jgi:hypothetical protein
MTKDKKVLKFIPITIATQQWGIEIDAESSSRHRMTCAIC